MRLDDEATLSAFRAYQASKDIGDDDIACMSYQLYLDTFSYAVTDEDEDDLADESD